MESGGIDAARCCQLLYRVVCACMRLYCEFGTDQSGPIRTDTSCYRLLRMFTDVIHCYRMHYAALCLFDPAIRSYTRQNQSKYFAHRTASNLNRILKLNKIRVQRKFFLGKLDTFRYNQIGNHIITFSHIFMVKIGKNS